MQADRLGKKVGWLMRSLLWQEIGVYEVASRAVRSPWERISFTLFLLQMVLIRVLVIGHILPRRLYKKDVWLRLRGERFCVGLRTREYVMLDEVYRERVYDRLPDFIPRAGWTVVDARANIGVFAVQAARRGAQVFAFEPHPDSYRHFMKTLAANGLAERIHVSNIAVGSSPGRGLLRELSPDWPHTSALTPAVEVPSAPPDNASAIPVVITSLDAIVPSLAISRIDLLNVYTGGVEVLEGATQTLGITERVMVEYRSVEQREQFRTTLESAGFALALDDADSHSPEQGILHLQKEP